MTLSIALFTFGGLSILIGSLTFVGIGMALNAAEIKAHANMRSVLRDMEGGRL